MQYVIHGECGRDLSEFNEKEQEILSCRDFEFRIVKTEGHTIYLEDISCEDLQNRTVTRVGGTAERVL